VKEERFILFMGRIMIGVSKSLKLRKRMLHDGYFPTRTELKKSNARHLETSFLVRGFSMLFTKYY